MKRTRLVLIGVALTLGGPALCAGVGIVCWWFDPFFRGSFLGW